MSTAGRLLEKLDKVMETDANAEVHIKPEDTVIRNATKHLDGVVPLCPTCGRDVIPGFINSSQVQCPGCQTDISLAQGAFPYRTLSGNRVAADGVVSKGTYGG